MARLVTTTRVTDPDGVDVVIGPGEAPEWAKSLVTNPAAWDDTGDTSPEGTPEGASESGQGDGEPDTGPSSEPGPDYASMTVAELRALVTERNAGRAPGERIPADGAKADLIAALTADDQG